MKLRYIDLCGFRGYRTRLRVDFGERFTIIDGRNGVGKSTIFDAVEFALTGTLGKYNDAKSAGETVDDYIWWTGEGTPAAERYVEVGFGDVLGDLVVRRTEFAGADQRDIAALTQRISDPALAPHEPLRQLCSTTIIRDEHIASLSLDLKETDRYALLRDALGANDAEKWIARGALIVSLAKKRSGTAQQEVSALNAEAAAAARRLDEVRAGLSSDAAVSDAVGRLRTIMRSSLAPDQLIGAGRALIAELTAEFEALQRLADTSEAVAASRRQLQALATDIGRAQNERNAAQVEVDAEKVVPPGDASSVIAQRARSLVALASLGRSIGLHGDHCPLCAAGRTHDEYALGLAAAEALARDLDAHAAERAEIEQRQAAAQARLAAASAALSALISRQADLRKYVVDFEAELQQRGLPASAERDEISRLADEAMARLQGIQTDVRIVDTLRLNSDLHKAQRAHADATDRLTRAQERFSRARKAESIAGELHDAARRAANETLDARLDRVLPLMSELYRRLRPHPVWRDIEYSIRGDVKRFLKLQVGEELNPQFLFSSGQRRATGLAFLLSVNLSLAWSRWRSIMLDDPVQHVDDFRTVHLAEVTAQLINEGRQIICAVEDAALADLLCRRLPISKRGDGTRITLGPDGSGDLAVLSHRDIAALASRSLVGDTARSASA